jgi:hypothetical protein
MFYSASSFSQNLTSWNTPFITTVPASFSSLSAMTANQLPSWNLLPPAQAPARPPVQPPTLPPALPPALPPPASAPEASPTAEPQSNMESPTAEPTSTGGNPTSVEAAPSAAIPVSSLSPIALNQPTSSQQAPTAVESPTSARAPQSAAPTPQRQSASGAFSVRSTCSIMSCIFAIVIGAIFLL